MHGSLLQNHILLPKETFLHNFILSESFTFFLGGGGKFDFLEGKHTNSSTSGKKFHFFEGEYTKSPCLGKKI